MRCQLISKCWPGLCINRFDVAALYSHTPDELWRHAHPQLSGRHRPASALGGPRQEGPLQCHRKPCALCRRCGVLVAHLTATANATTALWATIYLWARVIHYIGYTAGVPYVRTLSFGVGWLATLIIFTQIMGW